MDRSPQSHEISAPRRSYAFGSLMLALAVLAPSTGCLHQVIATGIYLWDGGNMVDPSCEDLKGQRVVVVCRPPASGEYTQAGASRQLGRSVTRLLRDNVSKVEMVDSQEVDQWMDESDWGDFKELGHAVKAERLVVIDMAHFDLYKGKTLYQGSADVEITVYDMTSTGNPILWQEPMGNVLFPQNSAIPAQDKPEQQFQREYVEVLARKIAVHFYKHDPHADFALDALANR